MEAAGSEEASANNKKEKIVKIISSVVDKVSENQQVSLNSILSEMRDLLVVIEETRDELGRAAPSKIKGEHIPEATDELDAIVNATSEATGTIMDSCDAIMEQTSAIEGDASEAITAEIMKIYEACSFQDITGQRISKVVTTFHDIEEKIDRLVSVLGIKEIRNIETDKEMTDEDLMNGPQLPDNAISQEDIDKLLAEFDE
ncbi:MAG: protein phosphatase CheZ [Alcanivorax sp.]